MTSEEQFKNYIDSLLEATTFSDAVKKDTKDVLLFLFHQGGEEQRQWREDAVIKKLRSIGFQIYDKGEVAIRDACINAGIEKL